MHSKTTAGPGRPGKRCKSSKGRGCGPGGAGRGVPCPRRGCHRERECGLGITPVPAPRPTLPLPRPVVDTMRAEREAEGRRVQGRGRAKISRFPRGHCQSLDLLGLSVHRPAMPGLLYLASPCRAQRSSLYTLGGSRRAEASLGPPGGPGAERGSSTTSPRHRLGRHRRASRAASHSPTACDASPQAQGPRPAGRLAAPRGAPP